MMESAINQNLMELVKARREEMKILIEIRNMLQDRRAEQVMRQTEEARKQDSMHIDPDEAW